MQDALRQYPSDNLGLDSLGIDEAPCPGMFMTSLIGCCLPHQPELRPEAAITSHCWPDVWSVCRLGIRSLPADWGCKACLLRRCWRCVGGQQQGPLQRQEQRHSVRRGPASAGLAAQLPEIPTGRGGPPSLCCTGKESTCSSTPVALEEEIFSGHRPDACMLGKTGQGCPIVSLDADNQPWECCCRRRRLQMRC